MATNEDSIRRAVKLLLEQYGQLKTSEVKKHLDEVIAFDNEDLEPSPTRNETKIMQRIGNIISHQIAPVKDYLSSYRVDKTKGSEAVWTLLTGLNGNQKEASTSDIAKRQRIRRNYHPKKTDWNALIEERGDLGLAGEQYVVDFEQQRVQSFSPADVIRVSHLSAEQGDGAGFDVTSINKNGEIVQIEVKTTKGGLKTPFYMSENEREYFRLNRQSNNLFLYRVYNFDIANGGTNAQIEIITPDKLFNDYNFDPTNYKVTHK
ncbi:DUF3883 domain-containing protein [Fructobacillus fructosus]|uniref:DUF3883 domain-containing protein n=1 Tax=Fructobacillus fructosus TaxID=1631 RepID=UPI002D815490|nr:Predicted restriction endonuclease [Fructobacillus fructosus]CAK1251342.1 Predicted restriction endonuclease [Fructobacillus fructosus]CAK1251827.1 Predicted restriction endonuclease [Fructobacillus fructosus]